MKRLYRNKGYGNCCIVEEVKIFPYKDAPKKETAYRVTHVAEYDSNFIYRIVTLEKYSEVIAELHKTGYDESMLYSELEDIPC